MKLLPLLTAAWLAAIASAHAENFRLQTNGGSFSVGVTSWRDIPFRTVVRQRYDYSCGSAALATLLRYHYGREADEAMIFRAMYETGDRDSIRRRGFSLLDMQRYLQGIGLQADGYRFSLDRLQELDTPAIAMIAPNGYRHFVVIKGVSGEAVLVGDPAAGITVYSRRDFEALWNGVVFVIHGEGVDGRFNQAEEWRPWAPRSFAAAEAPAALGPLTRELPPLYQITPVAGSVP
ncbi:MAG TPA: C39 family peptidase [Vitreimonas sp.]|uniref:C39 family peptidase n=1 Tax=Vitreimonas sp. TaxID=3069702 RepID=UPI002D6F954D|nr:C39 family peptidase [Vitreimonas sp.]HYD88426.1 C39 family peptidase [Vitreimonas sp.]